MITDLEKLLIEANLQATTGKAYEVKVKKFLEGKGFQVYRFDHANYMPDLLVMRKNEAVFIECKNYKSAKTDATAIKKMLNSELDKNDNKERAKLASHQSILYLIAYGGKQTVTIIT